MPTFISLENPAWGTFTGSVTAWSGTSGTIVAADSTGSTDVVNNQTLTRTGFVSRVDNTFAFNTGTRLIELSATGTNFQYWVDNKRFTITGTSYVFPAATGTEMFLYFNSAGAMTHSTAPWVISDPTVAPISLVYWGMTGQSGTYCDERHSAFRDRYLHRYLHNTRGTAYDNGLSGTFYSGNSGSFSFSSGRIWDEDINWDITGPVTNARFWFRSGSGMKFYDNATSSFSGGTAAPVFDLTGVMTPVTNTDYFNAWFYGTTEYNYPISIVMGQGQHTSLANAAAEGEPSIPGRSTREWKLLYQTIYRLQGGTTTFQSATDYRGAVTLPGQGSANTLPASQVTYIPTAPLSATQVQSALDQLATLSSPIYGGLYYNALPAASGGAADPPQSFVSGTWSTITASLAAYRSGSNGALSSTIQNGRVYVAAAGVYHFDICTSIECTSAPGVHIGLFVTGTEYPRFSQFNDLSNNKSQEMNVSGLVTLDSGQYVDVRLRTDAAVDIVIHHFSAHLNRAYLSGS